MKAIKNVSYEEFKHAKEVVKAYNEQQKIKNTKETKIFFTYYLKNTAMKCDIHGSNYFRSLGEVTNYVQTKYPDFSIINITQTRTTKQFDKEEK